MIWIADCCVMRASACCGGLDFRLLAHQHDGFRLCSLLVKRACSVDECRQLLDLDAATVQAFVHSAYLCGYAMVETPEGVTAAVAAPPSRNATTGGSLLSRMWRNLRARRLESARTQDRGAGRDGGRQVHTLVRALAGDRVVDTDVANTDSASDKLSTTVAMDYADIDLPNGDRLRLYGTPGQARFDFIWPVLLQGASGVLVLADASAASVADTLDRYLLALREHAPDVPAAIGLSKLDLAPHADIDALAMRAGDLLRPLAGGAVRSPLGCRGDAADGRADVGDRGHRAGGCAWLTDSLIVDSATGSAPT